jgi:rhizosphere induced protein
MKRHYVVCLSLSMLGGLMVTTSGHCSATKSFTFKNSEVYNKGHLGMYVEGSSCIADPSFLMTQLGTASEPKMLGPNEVISVPVRSDTGSGEGCNSDDAARFTLHFFENYKSESSSSEENLRFSSVVFSLGSKGIKDIENQGKGGLMIREDTKKGKLRYGHDYLVDWQGLTSYRRDIVYSSDGKLETVLQCLNTKKRKCLGSLSVKLRADELSNTDDMIIAKGSYNLRYHEIRSIKLRPTQKGKAALSTLPSVNILLSAKQVGAKQPASLLSANITGTGSGLQATQYNLNVVNNSSGQQSFCLFQKTQDPNIQPVVWDSQPLHQNMSARFSWSNNDYSFMAGSSGSLVPGVTVLPSQAVNASLGQQITFDGNRGMLYNVTNGPQADSLLIITESYDPTSRYWIGVGLSGYPLYISQAFPNTANMFTPMPNTVYITVAQQCQRGMLLDPDTVANGVPVVFSPTRTSLTATYTAIGTWNISPGGGGIN